MKRDFASLQDYGLAITAPTKRLKTSDGNTRGGHGSASIFAALTSPPTVRHKSFTQEEKEKRLNLFYNYQMSIRKEVEEVKLAEIFS